MKTVLSTCLIVAIAIAPIEAYAQHGRGGGGGGKQGGRFSNEDYRDSARQPREPRW